MNIEQQQVLIDRYPDLLDIAPCPLGPGMGFTFRIGAAGWFDLLDTFCQKVVAVTRSRASGVLSVRVTEIKEKMGELCIVCEESDEQIQGLIRQVRQESARTCQVCGQIGWLHILPGSVAATLCEDDAKVLSRQIPRVSANGQ